jgi:hypothetical protein
VNRRAWDALLRICLVITVLSGSLSIGAALLLALFYDKDTRPRIRTEVSVTRASFQMAFNVLMTLSIKFNCDIHFIMYSMTL